MASQQVPWGSFLTIWLEEMLKGICERLWAPETGVLHREIYGSDWCAGVWLISLGATELKGWGGLPKVYPFLDHHITVQEDLNCSWVIETIRSKSFRKFQYICSEIQCVGWWMSSDFEKRDMGWMNLSLSDFRCFLKIPVSHLEEKPSACLYVCCSIIYNN